MTSLKSSIMNYVFENGTQVSVAAVIINLTAATGRRYHSYQSGKYVLPNDEVTPPTVQTQYTANLTLGSRQNKIGNSKFRLRTAVTDTRDEDSI